MEFLADPTVGEVRIGCPEAIASGLLVKVLDQFSSLDFHGTKLA
jgi:DNA-binding transcriptional LysR family regulator